MHPKRVFPKVPFSAAMLCVALGSAACTGTIGNSPGQSGSGGGGASTGTGGAGGAEEKLAPAPGGLRRILARQYTSSIRLIFGDAAASEANPPVDPQLHG